MADFRRVMPALFVLAAVLIGLAPAYAQTAAFQCTANAAVPPLMRSEGMTELTGDVVLNCVGGTATAADAAVPQANITIFFNTTVTSRLLSSNSEALLLIDEPQAAAQRTSGALTGNGAGTEFQAAGTAQNVFQGSVSGNSITWIGVPIEAPGTTGTRVYRFTNMRVNASAVAPGGSGTPGQVIALISATPATVPGGLTSSFPINNPQQIVGFVTPGLTFSVRKALGGDATTSGFSIQQCVEAKKGTTPSIVLRYAENFATAFKQRTIANPTALPSGSTTAAQPAPVAQAQPGFIYNTESGFYNPALAAPYNTAGLADFGTRLKAVFNNIPAGVSIWAATSNAGATLTMLAQMTPNETAFFIGVPPTNTSDFGVPVAQLPVVSGSATAVWEVLGSDPLSTENYEFPIFFTAPGSASSNSPAPGTGTVNGSATAVWEVLGSDPLASQNFEFPIFFTAPGSAASNSPAPGTGTVNGSFAPTPPSFSATDGVKASSTLPIPRFVDTSSAINVVVVGICRTTLLFPFVTNQLGFDTGIAIANTSQDPFGTGVQSGTCTLSFYGANAPAAITTASIAGGTTYTGLASTSAPNFQGYMFAVCNFRYGHGFAFVSDLGARNLAMGYLALVLPETPRIGSTGFGGSGEILGQ